jgi:hypothetical protein
MGGDSYYDANGAVVPMTETVIVGTRKRIIE